LFWQSYQDYLMICRYRNPISFLVLRGRMGILL
jgi:hypothetical protein